jgi:hypothetical protein
MFLTAGVSMTRRIHQSPIWAASALGLLLIAGCGGSDRDEVLGSPHGKVTFNGGPLPKGSVLVIESTEIGVSRTASIAEDGTYDLSDTPLPVGTYKVAITPPPTAGVDASSADYDKMMSGGGAKPANPNATGFPVPEKFRSTTTSDKTVEVKEGSQELNIDITG